MNRFKLLIATLLFLHTTQSQSVESSRRNAITNAISDTSPGVASINVTQIQRYSVNPWYE